MATESVNSGPFGLYRSDCRENVLAGRSTCAFSYTLRSIDIVSTRSRVCIFFDKRFSTIPEQRTLCDISLYPYNHQLNSHKYNFTLISVIVLLKFQTQLGFRRSPNVRSLIY